ncbi:MAG: TonB-dependent receptor [Rhodospirillales bacterium]|nr:TonB-dependent receptor [Rhodospirillales bacterium]
MTPPTAKHRRRDERHGAAAAALAPALAALLASGAPAKAEAPADVDFTKLSLEELMDVEVTSVSKRRQRVADAAAAIFVIGQEDIRRSGATNVPELLRMVPGVEVARIDASKWAVSIRGFNARFATKLLVLVDGRSVYNPLFSGVYWNAQDVVLEDVERIEVIRGPGATMWGANAVNGVINIITKSAKDTQGTLLSAGGGTGEYGFGTARFGGKAGDKLAYRGYLKSFTVGDSPVASGDDGADATHQLRSGFRIDAEPSARDVFTLSGDVYKQDYGSTLPRPLLTSPYLAVLDDRGRSGGGNILGRWGRQFSETSALTLQAYYDRFKIEEQGLGMTIDVADVEAQHEFEAFSRNHVVWGFGYRYTRTAFDDNLFAHTTSNHRKDSILNAFVQDEIALIEDELRFTIGSKVEHNTSTGVEVQPSARLLWTPTPTQSVWGAVSRAVHVPSIGEEEAQIRVGVIPPGIPPNATGLPLEIVFTGKPDIVAEDLLAFELGYRAQPLRSLTFDIAGFYNIYDDLRTVADGTPFLALSPVPRVVVPAELNADGSAETYGIEVAADWEVFRWWRLKAAYNYFHDNLDVAAVGHGMNPMHQASLRSLIDLGHGWEFDLWPRYVDNLTDQNIESYVSLDARLGWRPTNAIEFSLVGQNLLDSRRKETVPELLPLTATQVERAAYGKLTLRF